MNAPTSGTSPRGRSHPWPIATAIAIAATALLPANASAAGSAPSATPPPQIYHIVTTPLCARLHDRVRPAVALILQNDQTIAKSPPLFHKYAVGAFGASAEAAGMAPANGDSINVDTPATQMALQQMSYLVSPIARNLIAAQTMLDDTALLKPTGDPAGDAQLAAIKAQLLQTVAYQSASLDIINGFVATQQMGELQHAGQEYIAGIQNGGSTAATTTPATPSPLQDPNSAGLAPNPYMVSLTAVPGLSVGYNPLSRLLTALVWIREQTATHEDAAASSVTTALASCNRSTR